jgi:hypothetical protein
MSELKVVAAETALKKLVQGSHFSICTLDAIIKMMDVKPDREAYSILQTLHCVDYNQMRPELLQALPDLIVTVLGSPSFEASRVNIVAEGTGLRIIKH